MLRGLIVVLFIILIVGAAVLGPRWLALQGENETGAAEPCLAAQQTCRWNTNGDDWQLALSQRSGAGKITLKVTTSTMPDRLLAVLSGESMYMGQYPVPLTKVAANTYRAEFTLPICTTDPDMRWQISLKANGEDVNSGALIPVFNAYHAPESID